MGRLARHGKSLKDSENRAAAKCESNRLLVVNHSKSVYPATRIIMSFKANIGLAIWVGDDMRHSITALLYGSSNLKPCSEASSTNTIHDVNPPATSSDFD